MRWFGELHMHDSFGVILGPTATGKTELGIELVERLKQELGVDAAIINADSRQIYTSLDIGTAKPTVEQQARARHFLLDIVQPDETLGLAEYLRLAKGRIVDCQRIGVLPIIVGGSGQYLSALLEDWQIPLVPPQQELRAQLKITASEKGSAFLHSRLRALDAPAAAKIHPNNLRRIVRALEVIEATGQPFSTQQRRGERRLAIFNIGLMMPRADLYQRADRRLAEMMEAGFLAEVRGLLASGYSRELPAMSALGYRQMVAHLLGEMGLEDALAETRQATRQFIRRQLSWFRGHEMGTKWQDITLRKPAVVVRELLDEIEKSKGNWKAWPLCYD